MCSKLHSISRQCSLASMQQAAHAMARVTSSGCSSAISLATQPHVCRGSSVQSSPALPRRFHGSTLRSDNCWLRGGSEAVSPALQSALQISTHRQPSHERLSTIIIRAKSTVVHRLNACTSREFYQAEQHSWQAGQHQS